jgi:hypothetical protein
LLLGPFLRLGRSSSDDVLSAGRRLGRGAKWVLDSVKRGLPTDRSARPDHLPGPGFAGATDVGVCRPLPISPSYTRSIRICQHENIIIAISRNDDNVLPTHRARRSGCPMPLLG